MEEKQDLIIVKQLPIIEERLKQLSKEIEEKVEKANGLICTEENKTVVKELRANLNKEFAEFEAQRKEVKQKVLEPYNQFEKAYKENVSDKYKEADKLLKEKIETIENQQKLEKENELKTYFYECRSEHNIDFIDFGNVGLNITLSASTASLKKQIEEFINKVVSDLELIETQENKAEILVEYKKDLNISRAIKDVIDRKKAVLEIEKQRVESELEKEKQNIENNLEQLKEQQKLNEKIYTITFKVTGTAPRLKQLKDYLIREGYQYE